MSFLPSLVGPRRIFRTNHQARAAFEVGLTAVKADDIYGTRPVPPFRVLITVTFSTAYDPTGVRGKAGRNLCRGSKLQTGSFSWFGVTSMAEVRLQEGESLENALRRFKRKVMTEDIIKDVKRHSYYLKPGERRRVKQALAQKRARKKIRKDGDQAAPRRGAAAK